MDKKLFYIVLITVKGYRLANPREKLVDRKEFQNYDKSGKGYKTKVKKDIEVLVVRYLKNNNYKSNLTYKKLAQEIGLLNNVFAKAYSTHLTKDRNTYFKSVMDELGLLVTAEAMFWEVASREATKIVNYVKDILKQLNKEGYIILSDKQFGLKTNNSIQAEKVKFVELTLDEIKQIEELDTSLEEKYALYGNQRYIQKSSEQYIQYKEERQNKLNKIGYEYTFTAANIQVTEKINIYKEVEGVDIGSIKDDLRSHSIELAGQRQKDFFEKLVPIRNNKALQSVLGGKLKSEVLPAIPEVLEYQVDKVYTMYGNNNILVYDEMLATKFSNMYATEYEEILNKIY